MSKTTTGTSTDESPVGQDDQGLGAAGSQLSTAPQEPWVNLPGMGVLGWARWFWRQLTSMRVALLLLLLLSLGAVAASFFASARLTLRR